MVRCDARMEAVLDKAIAEAVALGMLAEEGEYVDFTDGFAKCYACAFVDVAGASGKENPMKAAILAVARWKGATTEDELFRLSQIVRAVLVAKLNKHKVIEE